jgi:hypothetical protein
MCWRARFSSPCDSDAVCVCPRSGGCGCSFDRDNQRRPSPSQACSQSVGVVAPICNYSAQTGVGSSKSSVESSPAGACFLRAGIWQSARMQVALRQECPGRQPPHPAIDAGPAWTVAFTRLPANFLPLPTSLVGSSRLNQSDTVRVGRAVWLQYAKPTKSPPDKINSMPTGDLVRPRAASVPETEVPTPETATRSIELPASSGS